MKQFILLLILLLVGTVGYNGYQLYGKKTYTSWYEAKKKSDSVVIEEVTLNKEKIAAVIKNIKQLKQDPVFKLKVNEFTAGDKASQPLFLEKYDPLYEKIVKQQQLLNRPN